MRIALAPAMASMEKSINKTEAEPSPLPLPHHLLRIGGFKCVLDGLYEPHNYLPAPRLRSLCAFSKDRSELCSDQGDARETYPFQISTVKLQLHAIDS